MGVFVLWWCVVFLILLLFCCELVVTLIAYTCFYVSCVLLIWLDLLRVSFKWFLVDTLGMICGFLCLWLDVRWFTFASVVCLFIVGVSCWLVTLWLFCWFSTLYSGFVFICWFCCDFRIYCCVFGYLFNLWVFVDLICVFVFSCWLLWFMFT